jgi:hypothetical protein
MCSNPDKIQKKKKLFFHVDVIIVNIFASVVSQNETKMPGDLTTLSERN